MGKSDIDLKMERLKEILINMGKVAVAFSGGVDSTFLLAAATEVLHDNVIAITAMSPAFPERELSEAADFAKSIGAKHITFEFDPLKVDGISNNPQNRCYICKKAIFSQIVEIAGQNGITHIVDGSNLDDVGDYRPGMQALKELGIEKPLMNAGLTKDDIRKLSQRMGLPTWNKPSYACLATRIPYGQEITNEKLHMIDAAEQYLIDIGFRQVRVRHHGDVARIEVAVEERSRFFNTELMDKVNDSFNSIGFKYVALDLKGYRKGSMNAGIG
jgi:uncharacterized protein